MRSVEQIFFALLVSLHSRFWPGEIFWHYRFYIFGALVSALVSDPISSCLAFNKIITLLYPIIYLSWT